MIKNSCFDSRSRVGLNRRADSVNSRYDSDSETESDHFPSKTLFVNNIDPNVSKKFLETALRKLDSNIKLKIKTHKEKQSYAYVKYDHPNDAREALQSIQYKKVGRYEIIVMTPTDRRKLRSEGKIFVKGLNEETTTKDLHRFFEEISKDMYVRISTDEEGNHLNIGCVHFFDPRHAEQALEEFQGKEFQGTKLQLRKWLPKDERRQKPKQNLHISNLQQKTKNELKIFYTPKFEKFGEIERLVFNEIKLSAMLMYKIPDDAQHAFNNLKKLEDCSHLEVNWLKTPDERAKEAHERKNRLYLDGLSYQVTEEDLREKFGQYGHVLHCIPKASRTRQKNIETQWVVIVYETEEEAEKALGKASKNSEISKLFISLQHKKIEYFEEKRRNVEHQKKYYQNNNYVKPPPPSMLLPFRRKQQIPMHSYIPQPVFLVPALAYGVPTLSPQGGFIPRLIQPLQDLSRNQNYRPPEPFYPEESKTQSLKYQPKAIIEEQENLDNSSFYSNSMDVSGLDSSKISKGHNDSYSFEVKKQNLLFEESSKLSHFSSKNKEKKEVGKRNVPSSFW